MQRSFIREILDITNDKSISFAGGLPDISKFPNKKLQKIASKVFEDKNLLQYSSSLGFYPLRKKIAQFYNNEGFKTSPKNIMITSGSQQALDIISRYYKNKSITTESPSYLGAMNIFRLNNIKQSSVILNDNGIDLDGFKRSLKKTKLAYLIPDYQNPTGKTYTQKNRKNIANIVKKHNALIIEDTPYKELYFDKKYKSISQNLPKNSYILGSFSKVLAPSFRVGWIRAHQSLINPLISYKEIMDLHTNNLSQYILNEYLKNDKENKKYLKDLREFYLNKRDIFCDILDKDLSQFKYKKPKGGMFIYGKIKNIDTKELVKKSIKKDVYFVPGIEFYNNKSTTDEIRFNFTNASKKEVSKGLKTIAKVLEDF